MKVRDVPDNGGKVELTDGGEDTTGDCMIGAGAVGVDPAQALASTTARTMSDSRRKAADIAFNMANSSGIQRISDWKTTELTIFYTNGPRCF